ncbi:hypothetical protein JHK82_027625 [Glycine max]|nr:soyasaponin III rhamnosyltransferase-like [Glycine soja]KAG5126790.1 hypothetical protein JHK82_027625 [Glycine max]KAH1137623.1 hypothetical protein GYH30_027580 [Glycine max]KHN27169.1 Putative UDP-rhamnose:rhamnosyltransferase 1 [Glycine soja]RZB86632.1 Soyasaponin III rhamnosyltransferase [Glycine soja]
MPLHIAMLPWLAVGHVNPYLELSKILAQKGHFVTFISTPKNIDGMPKIPETLQPSIKLVRLPLPHTDHHHHLPEDAESTMDIPSNKSYYLKLAYEALQGPVSELLKTSKPDWVFYDFATEWLPPIAKSLNIPCAHYNLTAAWNKVFIDPPKDYQLNNSITLQDMCLPPTWLPFTTTVHLRPHEIRRATSSIKDSDTGRMANFDLRKAYSSCDMFLLRTCRELEGEWLDYLAHKYKVPVVPVGLVPPSIQIRDVEEEDNNPDWVKIKDWLDKQESSSVVYIGFGSELRLSQQDVTELAHGIELSGLRFFWALRNLQKEDLPHGFEERTKERGIVWKSWAPQIKILGHAAIGGCITHCGTNSLVEMLNFGHVLVTLPYLLDQALFSRVLEEKKVGIEVPRSEKDGSFTRDDVAKTLKLAIVDEEGSDYRKNAKEMGKVFSSTDLHSRYIDNCIVALQKYKTPNSNC